MNKQTIKISNISSIRVLLLCSFNAFNAEEGRYNRMDKLRSTTHPPTGASAISILYNLTKCDRIKSVLRGETMQNKYKWWLQGCGMVTFKHGVQAKGIIFNCIDHSCLGEEILYTKGISTFFFYWSKHFIPFL